MIGYELMLRHAASDAQMKLMRSERRKNENERQAVSVVQVLKPDTQLLAALYVVRQELRLRYNEVIALTPSRDLARLLDQLHESGLGMPRPV